MLLTIASSLIFVEKRRLVNVIPEPLRKVWNEWELRVMVLLSLTLQASLIFLGNRRKCDPRTRIRIFLWSVYLMADWVATVALGVLSNSQGNSCSSINEVDDTPDDELELTALWAPFLLLHLGGPDTITAYALEDNELWLRHFLGLVVQTGVALYIFLMAWKGTLISYLTIPMLLAGLIKYGERTWVLRSANSEQFRDSMLTAPDPGPNYAKFMDEFSLKKAEGFHVVADEVIEAPVPADHSNYTTVDGVRHDNIVDASILLKAHDLFRTFKRLFVGLILSFHDRDTSQSFFQSLTPDTAFKVIEIELGFAYDVFYTKVPLIYTLMGCLFRCFTFFVTLLVLVLFLIFEKHNHSQQIDLIITYILLVGAILLEISALILLLSSDWTNLWLSNHRPKPNPENKEKKHHLKTLIFGAISWLQLSAKQRWSNSMAQYNLLSFCLKDKPAFCHGIQKLFCMDEMLEKHRYKAHSRNIDDLKALIFEHFLEKSQSDSDLMTLCTCRGGLVLKNYDCLVYDWSTKVEFDQSILIWHIATDLCFYSDDGENSGAIGHNREASKHISDYMLYLLVMCPFMLPIGIGMIRFRDTCEEVMEFFQERSPMFGEAQACKMLLQVSTEVLPTKVKGDRSKSVLFDASRLASSLQMLEKEKWKIVSNVWMEILGYAASHCRGNYHAQQLRRGGELLTHVWLLMAHLGITEQFQISQGHARAKLRVR